jgi:diguanylate cyclase (GGDEF)-like protein
MGTAATAELIFAWRIMPDMAFSPPATIAEFVAAARNPFSYDLRRNIYIWFGLFWGIPIPLVTIFYELRFLRPMDGLAAMFAILGSPLQWFFFLHPLLFGAVFGILGTIRQEKESELQLRLRQLRDLAIHDQLTGLKNRRYFAHIFHDECARNLRRNETMSILFLDIDHFKKINDSLGHHQGDIVLKELGNYLKNQCRPYDIPVRWGGEEFLILLRATDEQSAMHFAERIRKQVENGISPALPCEFTVSIGLAEYQENDTLEALTDRADQALYHAKQTGRNRVVSWSMLYGSDQQ